MSETCQGHSEKSGTVPKVLATIYIAMQVRVCMFGVFLFVFFSFNSFDYVTEGELDISRHILIMDDV